MPTRKRDFRVPPAVPYGREPDGPMGLALQGGSGTLRGRDHSGTEVLAAYEWLPFLELGLLCKIDMAEIRAPFVRAALWTAAIALGLVLLGFYVNARTLLPLSRVVGTPRRSASAKPRISPRREHPGAVFRAAVDEGWTFLELSDAIEDITGRPAAAFLPGGGAAYRDAPHPDDEHILQAVSERRLELTDRPTPDRYGVPTGRSRWVSSGARSWKGPRGRRCSRAHARCHRPESRRTGLGSAAAEALEVPLAEVYRSIFEGHQDVRVGSSRKKLTVFFSDIVGFTAKSDTLDPDDLSFIIYSYLNPMAEAGG